jgi:hypothetical protein
MFKHISGNDDIKTLAVQTRVKQVAFDQLDICQLVAIHNAARFSYKTIQANYVVEPP